MRQSCRRQVRSLAAAALFALAARPGRSVDPLLIGGTNGVPGQPFVWTINPVTYWTDQGMLGPLSNAAADGLVSGALGNWQSVPTAMIAFQQAGKLPEDITSTNILTAFNQLFNCSAPIDPNNTTFIVRDRSVIYDADGSAIRALGASPEFLLGIGGPVCFSSDGVNNSLERGFALMNGGSTGFSSSDMSLVMTHEFGHMIGLGHAQVNAGCLFSACSPDFLAGVPMMFPVLTPQNKLAADDIAAVSVLYPTPNPAPSGKVPFGTFGRIQGHVLFSDARTPAQGYNVIARLATGPGGRSGSVAVSSVSGFLFTTCVTNPALPVPHNDCGPGITPFGSRDQTLIGFYDIPGLPVGQQYEIEVEEINTKGLIPFLGGSTVGPIGEFGFQFPLPNGCTFPSPSGGTSICVLSRLVSPVAGQVVPVDINLPDNQGLTRYDAWEDGP